MHIQAEPALYKVMLTRKEIEMINFGLALHAANDGTVKEKVAHMELMMKKFINAINQHKANKGKGE